MATYKVLQNIEADDKFLGPLSLKQFIYAAITAICIYLSLYSFLKGIVWVMFVLFLPAVISGFLAFPWGRDQSTETWLLGKIRFAVKPKVRIWDQTGPDNLVSITVPKKIDKHLIKDLSPNEVTSRLKALAETIDSRGWATKNVTMMPSTKFSDDSSDRLIQPESMPLDVPSVDVAATEDILDSETSPLAQKLNNLISTSAENHHQEALASINKARQAQPAEQQKAPTDYWFMKTPDLTDLPDPSLSAFGATTIHPDSEASAAQSAPLTAEEQDLLKKIHDEEALLNPKASALPAIKTHVQTEDAEIAPAQPITSTPQPNLTATDQTTAVPASSTPPAQTATQTQAQAASTNEDQSDKLRLATNNDRSVESIAREANNNYKTTLNSDGEVVISLH